MDEDGQNGSNDDAENVPGNAYLPGSTQLTASQQEQHKQLMMAAAQALNDRFMQHNLALNLAGTKQQVRETFLFHYEL
jgi:hypothetical protein